MKKRNLFAALLILPVVTLFFTRCDDDDDDDGGMTVEIHDPDMAEKVAVDRFSNDFGNLFIRDASNGFPAANEPVDFDVEPFITMGLGPNGEMVKYYNFDVLPFESAPIYVLFRDGESSSVEDQLNIIDVIPGDDGYNDFWNVVKVTVPADYIANTIASVDELMEMDYPMETTGTIVNCPVVPEGSTATLRYNASEDKGLIRGWYKEKVVFYFTFAEKSLMVAPPSQGTANVPLSDIYVSFNINPDQQGGGPASGFMTEPGTSQTHNVVETLPADDDYSPFWDVNIYDNMDFGSVNNLQTATGATILAEGAAFVNCPVVSVQ